MNLTPENKILLLSAKIHLPAEVVSEVNLLLQEVKDWDQMADALIARGMGPLFYRHMPQLPDKDMIPRSAQEKLKQTYYLTLSRNMVFYDVFRKVITAFTANSIPAVALKGIHLSDKLYRDIGLRQLSDIDLLVRKPDGEKSLQVLREIGFVQSGDEVSHLISEKTGIIHYPAMVSRDVSVEIHIRLHGRREAYSLDVEQMIARSVELTINGVDARVLEVPDLLIHLCIHLDKHFRSGEVQYTGFCDIVNLLDIHGGEIDWEKLDARCRMYNCQTTVYKYMLLVHTYFNVPLPAVQAQQFSSCLTTEDTELFERYLNGYKGVAYGASTHIDNVGRINGLLPKLRYLGLIVFPTKAFMLQNYRIKNPSLYWLYYPARHWKGLKGVWRMMKQPPNPRRGSKRE